MNLVTTKTPIHSRTYLPGVEQNRACVSPEDGRSLFSTITGSGSAVVLCDGLFCQGHIWRYLRPFLARSHQVVHWHYPGHGQSGTPGRYARVGPGRLVRDLEAILNSAGLDEVSLIGHSFGVRVVLEMALALPHRVRAGVLICGAADGFADGFALGPSLNRLLPVLDMMTHFGPGQVTRFWKRLPVSLLGSLAGHADWFNHRLLALDDLKPYFQGMVNTDLNVAIRMLRAADENPITPRLPKIESRMLVLGGHRDRFTPVARSRELAASLPNAELILAASATHALPLEQPDLVNFTVEDFLGR